MRPSLATQLLLQCLIASALVAQCANSWTGNLSLPVPAGVFDFAEWDPDGPGPLLPRLVAACQPWPVGSAPSVVAFDDVTATWQAVGVWSYASAWAVEPRPTGELVATAFDPASGPTAHRVVQWDGLTWSPLGGVFDRVVYCAAVLPNGDLVVGGDFQNIGTTPIAHVARWDGVAWSALGVGPGQYCDELLALPNGDLIAAGLFGVSRWNGVVWTSLGGSGMGWGLSLASDDTGRLYAGWYHNWVGRWDGLSWTALGGPVFATSLADVEDLVVLPNGDLLAAEGNQNGSGSVVQVARWNGSTWLPVATANGPVIALAVRRSRGVGLDVVAGGRVSNVAGVAVTNIAQWITSCPPSIAATASGCPAGGPALAVNPAWVGGIWIARASGLPQPGFAVGVTGVSTTVTSLGALLPQAAPGCLLLVAPDVLHTLAVSNGEASTTWTLPNTTTIAGATFRHQVIALGGASSITSVVATAAATLTVGAF
jgi:hypothetical protein